MMAQPFKFDIFAEDIDVEAPTKKPPLPPLLTYMANYKPLSAERQKQWDSYKTNIKNKKKNKAKTPQVKNPLPTPPAKINWQPIPAVGQPDAKRQVGKKPIVKKPVVKKPGKGMDRSNLKVVEGTAGSIKLNLDKSKAVTVQEVKAPSKPMENKQEPNVAPAVSNPAPNPMQSSGVKGRMPASAFMNIDQLPTKKSIPQPSAWTTHPMLHPAYSMYPKGIPKSFLTDQHKQLLQSQQPGFPNPQTAVITPPAKGPVWEAKIPSAKAKAAPAPVWHQRFDQPPIGLFPPNTGQIVGEDGQPFGLGQPFAQVQSYGQSDQSFGPGGQAFVSGEQSFGQSSQTFGQPMFVQADSNMEGLNAQYSPSDAYTDMVIQEPNDEIPGESSDSQQSGSKRLSAFKRLGPVTQPKKPKLTINLMVGKEQAVREVVDESENPEMDKYIPVLQRPDIQTSLDDTVMKYVSFWPWKKTLSIRRTVTARESKSVMQLELEQMDEYYEKDKMFFGVLVTGYPESWSKEDVMDAVLEALKGKSFIPCFIEFTKNECKFLLIRSRPALLAIHKMGFVYRKDDILLNLTIMQANLSVNQIDFIPRLILRKRLSMSMDGETELNLKQFTLAHDVSHFLYFPLSRLSNQSELMQLQSSVPWQALTKLVLSHNRIANLSGFNLVNHTPRLRCLDLSFNRIEGITGLLTLRELPLNSLMLEGNPLCTDYTDPERYIKVLKMIFSGLREIDGVKLSLPGDFPPYKRNYSPPDAVEVTSKVLETLFPLLDADPEERQLCEDLYVDDAVMTVTFMYKLRYGPIYKDYRTLFSRARIMDEGEMDAIEGASAIAKLIHRWPKLEHDPLTFTVDVIYHTDTTTILRISGIMKVTAETLAEDEHLLRFNRTLVVHSLDSREYKITNEMVYWDLPDKEQAREAFKMTAVRSKNLNLKLDGPPDADLREKLLEIFMKLTDMDRKPSERCLESKDWHLRNALEYFSKLLKLDNLDPLFV